MSKYICVTTEEQLQRVVSLVLDYGHCGLDTETDSDSQMTANLVGISISHKPEQGFYIPVGHVGSTVTGGQQAMVFDEQDARPDQLPVELVIGHLQAIAGPRIIKYVHNLAFDWVVLRRYGLSLQNCFDTMVAHRVIVNGQRESNGAPVRSGLDAMAKKYYGHTTTKFKDLVGKGQTFANVSLDKATAYAVEDSDFGLRFGLNNCDSNDPGVKNVLNKIEMPVTQVLARMQYRGIRLDRKHLTDAIEAAEGNLAVLQSEIDAVAGRPIAVGATNSLSDFVYGDLGMPTAGVKKHKTTGKYLTARGYLEVFAHMHPVIPKILEVLTWKWLLSNPYANLERASRATGRAHTEFGLAVTGRVLSRNPALQNIPIRSEVGRELRKAFVADKGHVLIAADYSQVELRVLAHIAEPNMRRVFWDDGDIHTATAAEVLSILTGSNQVVVTKNDRRNAKAVNFGIIFGSSAVGIAHSTGMDIDEAEEFCNAYFAKYPGVKKYLDDQQAFVKRNGFSQTIYGRRRYGDLSYSVAANNPIQGTAADICKLAMIKVDDWLIRNSGAKLVLQIHDELIISCPEDEVHYVAPQVQFMMENIVDLKVPLKVDAEVGPSWGDCK